MRGLSYVDRCRYKLHAWLSIPNKITISDWNGFLWLMIIRFDDAFYLVLWHALSKIFIFNQHTSEGHVTKYAKVSFLLLQSPGLKPIEDTVSITLRRVNQIISELSSNHFKNRTHLGRVVAAKLLSKSLHTYRKSSARESPNPEPITNQPYAITAKSYSPEYSVIITNYSAIPKDNTPEVIFLAAAIVIIHPSVSCFRDAAWDHSSHS